MIPVLFAASNSQPVVGEFSLTDYDIFGQVFVNAGNSFDEESGRFICHHPGIYFFTYTVQSYLDKYVGIQLMKNNEPQVRVNTIGD